MEAKEKELQDNKKALKDKEKELQDVRQELAASQPGSLRPYF